MIETPRELPIGFRKDTLLAKRKAQRRAEGFELFDDWLLRQVCPGLRGAIGRSCGDVAQMHPLLVEEMAFQLVLCHLVVGSALGPVHLLKFDDQTEPYELPVNKWQVSHAGACSFRA